MAKSAHDEIIAILQEGKDLTIATLRPDGWPQATTVSYASDGLAIYFGCGEDSQKARNLAGDDRVSVTVNLPYADWSQIRGVSLAGRALRLGAEEIERFGELFLAKFPEVAQYVSDPAAGLAMFRVTPEVISLLDYSQGFGHTEELQVIDPTGAGKVEPLTA